MYPQLIFMIFFPMSSIAKDAAYIVDAMSSFGAIPIEFEGSGIDFLISSANKCLEGVPGFGFTIAKIETMKKCQGI